MSISADGGNDGDAQTRNCPDCSEEMEYDVIREHGTRKETTLYQGWWWCSNCRKGMVACGECDSLHHPDFECEPKRKARFKAAQEAFGGKVEIPRHGTVSIDDCETIDEGTPVYIIDDGCPDCEGDLIFELVRNSDFAEKHPPKVEYEAICEYCSQLNDGCSYRRP
jgi:hypothetical protein